MNHFIKILLLLSLAACARPQSVGFSTPHADGTQERIFVATMRSVTQNAKMFGQTRAGSMSYAMVDISVPPGHQPGVIERGTGMIDARKHFAPLAAEQLTGAKALAQAIKGHQTNNDEPLLLFVHGYNNTQEDAAFRLAQIQHDFELRNPALLFSWPSAGDPLGYVYDRDSIMFARSDFGQLLRDLRNAGQRRILILAHSMGSYLVMEALRQLKLEGNAQVFSAIDGVVLMSPDIDPDIFRRQAEEIGKLPQPFVIMTTQKDRVLNLSSLLTGRKERLGRIQNADEVAGLDVSVLDFSLFEAGQSFGHLVPVSSPAAIELLRRLAGGMGSRDRAFEQYLLLGDGKRNGRTTN